MSILFKNFGPYSKLRTADSPIGWPKQTQPYNKYFLLAEFSVRTVNYRPSFFLSIYGPSAKRVGRKSMEKNEDP